MLPNVACLKLIFNGKFFVGEVKMNENFLLYKQVKDFSFEMMKYTANIPRSLMYIRNGIQDTFQNAVKLIRYYIVNMNESARIKTKYLKDLIVELSMIDYYLECLFFFRVIGKNKYNAYVTDLENIRKLAYGVINSEKKSSQV